MFDTGRLADAPKDTKDSIPYQLYTEFASPEEISSLQDRYNAGIGWGEVKELLYLAIDKTLAEKTKLYHDLVADRSRLQNLLEVGAERAREVAVPFLKEIKKAALG